MAIPARALRKSYVGRRAIIARNTSTRPAGAFGASVQRLARPANNTDPRRNSVGAPFVRQIASTRASEHFEFLIWPRWSAPGHRRPDSDEPGTRSTSPCAVDRCTSRTRRGGRSLGNASECFYRSYDWSRCHRQAYHSRSSRSERPNVFRAFECRYPPSPAPRAFVIFSVSCACPFGATHATSKITRNVLT